jgi:hypothetical protein
MPEHPGLYNLVWLSVDRAHYSYRVFNGDFRNTGARECHKEINALLLPSVGAFLREVPRS